MTNTTKHWRDAAACLTADPELFFPVATTGCLEDALATLPDGIAGGLTEDERSKLRHQRTKVPAATPVPATPPAPVRRLEPAATATTLRKVAREVEPVLVERIVAAAKARFPGDKAVRVSGAIEVDRAAAAAKLSRHGWTRSRIAEDLGCAASKVDAWLDSSVRELSRQDRDERSETAA